MPDPAQPDKVRDTAQPDRRGFWLTVLVGLAGSGIAAIAGNKDWFAATPTPGLPSALSTAIDGNDALSAPAVTALALVALAAWGVLLVTRRWVRRAVAGLAALAAAGAFVSGVVALSDVPHGTHRTGAWPWLALLGALAAVLAACLAVARARRWPEMGRKYDAPAGAPVAATPGPDDLAEADNIDLWKSITEGRDPTVDRDE